MGWALEGIMPCCRQVQLRMELVGLEVESWLFFPTRAGELSAIN